MMPGYRECQFIVCLLMVTAVATKLASAQEQSQQKCWTAKDCSSCLKAGPTCAWCQDQNLSPGFNRCNEINARLFLCTNITVLESTIDDVSTSDDIAGTTQVKPQKIKLKLRPGQVRSFRLDVKPLKNFPVDIYFLMDRSSSMDDDFDTLISVAEDIANAIGNLTKNYRLAVGIFMDKSVNPGVPIANRIFPCNSTNHLPDQECRPSTSFVHASNFSENITRFSNVLKIQNEILSADADTAESPFEGLLQLSVCEKFFQWKPKGRGRRLVVIVTDAPPKIAGDGKLAGLIRPSDGECYMDFGEYHGYHETFFTKDDEMDYPSIQQLKRIMFENSITPILAVTEDQLPMYQAIAKEWEVLGGAASLLSNDSSNIVQILIDNYNRLTSTVELSDDADSSLKIEYEVNRTSCANTTNPSQCSNIQVGQTVSFDVKLTLLECPEDPSKNRRVTINTSDFGKVSIDLEYLCDCNCTKEKNSPICSSSGTYECGICKCNSGHYGDKCECDNSQSPRNDTADCIDPSDPDEFCNGKGDCVCGTCRCRNQYPKVSTGKYCECSNFGCPLLNGTECGGRGVCECGKCICDKPYEGENCGKTECMFINETRCMNNGTECSGNGECDCLLRQRCRCDVGYDGEYCQNCRTTKCKCDPISDCLTCEIRNETCQPDLNCTLYNFLGSNETFTTDCTVFIDNCYYGVNVTNVYLNDSFSSGVMYRLIGCPLSLVPDEEEPNILIIILAIIGGILLLALLLLLLWKLLVTLHDKREFSQFQESGRNYSELGKNGNPIYKEPNQQFVNPIFEDDDDDDA